LDLAAVATRVGVAQVVGEEEQDIETLGRSGDERRSGG
jgi:hypothetical protein